MWYLGCSYIATFLHLCCMYNYKAADTMHIIACYSFMHVCSFELINMKRPAKDIYPAAAVYS